jgi:diguanylate cyclase
LLPDTALADAIAALARYLREFSASAIDGCALSFSAGVVALQGDDSPAAAIARADAATYVAKRAGKNRVVTG